jgi:hypothetical protein
VQGLRRRGKLDYEVNEAMKLEVGDCILLKGESDRTENVAKLAVTSG